MVTAGAIANAKKVNSRASSVLTVQEHGIHQGSGAIDSPPATTTSACSLKTPTPTPTLTLTTTAMQMLPLMAVTSFEHRGPQCLLTLGRSTSPPLDQFPVRVCSCPLRIINRL